MKKRKIIFFSSAVVFALLFFVYFFNLINHGIDQDLINIDDGWDVSYHAVELKRIRASNFKIPSEIKRGDTIVYKKILDAGILPNSTLRFRSFHVVASVYLDDELLYEFGKETFKKDKMVGSGYHFINLPEQMNGRTLTLEIVVAESAAKHTNIMVEVLKDKVVSDFFSRRGLSAGIGIFLCLFGVIAIIFGIASLTYSRSFFRLILIGSISFLMGTWTLCYMKVLQMFSMDLSFNTLLEFIVLYLVPIPICMLLTNMRRRRLVRWKFYGLNLCTYIGIAFFVVSTLLHALNIVHYSQCLHIYHVYIVAVFLYVAVARILRDRMFHLQDKILVYGVALFLIFAMGDLARFLLQWEFSFLDSNVDVTLLPLGTLVFVVFLMVSYVVYLYEVVMDKTEKEMLKQIAFRDSLTGLYNRAKCNRIFEVLDNADSRYAIVSLDLNGLKFVNDTYGHSVGDNLLLSFSEIFKKAFSGVGTSIRMGGDEFVAIVRAEHLGDLPEALNDLECLERDFSSDLPVSLEAAYGFAVHEKGDSTTAMEVYKLADQKMYEMKVTSKKNRE